MIIRNLKEVAWREKKEKRKRKEGIFAKFLGRWVNGIEEQSMLLEKFLHDHDENDPVYLGRGRRSQVASQYLWPCFLWLLEGKGTKRPSPPASPYTFPGVLCDSHRTIVKHPSAATTPLAVPLPSLTPLFSICAAAARNHSSLVLTSSPPLPHCWCCPLLDPLY